MTHINDKSTYFCGPYQDYCGSAEYDAETDFYHGEIIGTQDVITFQGRNPAELRKAFQGSVDDYLAFCKAQGASPNKPFSGKFVTRIDPELHRKLSALAEMAGKSLNQYICEALAMLADRPASVWSTASGATKTARGGRSRRKGRASDRVAKVGARRRNVRRAAE